MVARLQAHHITGAAQRPGHTAAKGAIGLVLWGGRKLFWLAKVTATAPFNVIVGDSKKRVHSGEASWNHTSAWLSLVLFLTVIPALLLSATLRMHPTVAWAAGLALAIALGPFLTARRVSASKGVPMTLRQFYKGVKSLLSHEISPDDAQKPPASYRAAWLLVLIAAIGWAIALGIAIAPHVSALATVVAALPPAVEKFWWVWIVAAHALASVPLPAWVGRRRCKAADGEEAWELVMAKIFSVSEQDLRRTGDVKVVGDRVEVRIPVPGRGKTAAQLDERCELFCAGYTCTGSDGTDYAIFESVASHPDVLAAREAKRDSGGLIAGVADLPDAEARPEAAQWTINPASRATPEQVATYAASQGVDLVEWDAAGHTAAVAKLPPQARKLRDQLARALGVYPTDLELVFHAGDRGAAVEIVRLPPELDTAKRDARYLQALEAIAPGNDLTWKVTSSTHARLAAELRVDPLAETQLYPWGSVKPAYNSIPFGTREDGKPLSLGLLESNILLGGVPGSGKSGGLTTLISGVAQLESVAIIGLDPKKVEQADWAPRFSRIATEDDEATEILERLSEEMERRYDRLAKGHRKKLTPEDLTPESPLLVLVIDELADLLAIGATREEKDAELNRSTLIRRLVAKGRAAGITVISATQKPEGDVIPTKLRDLLQQRVAYATTTSAMTETILGAGAAQNGGLSHEIPNASKGVCYVIDDTSRTPVRAKTYWIPDGEVAGIAERTAHLRVDLPWLTGAPEGLRKKEDNPFDEPDVVELDEVEFTLDDLEPDAPAEPPRPAFSFDD